jgi:hypothetical protein
VTFTLAIVERSHRGAVEQQYAHVLWLVHGLHRQSPMALLLRGGAVAYALDGPAPAAVSVGDEPWGHFPDYAAAVRRLRADGASVFVAQSSLIRLGLADRPLSPDVELATDQRIAEVAASAIGIWFL